MRNFFLASAVMLGLAAALPAAALAAPPMTAGDLLSGTSDIQQVQYRDWRHGRGHYSHGYRYGPPRGYYGRRHYGPPPYGYARGHWRHRHYYGRPYYRW